MGLSRSQKLSAKFSEDQCVAIREMWNGGKGKSFTAISNIYGVCHETISRIFQPEYAKKCNKRTYQWIIANHSPEKRKAHLTAVRARIKLIDPDRQAIYKIKREEKLKQNNEKNNSNDSDGNTLPNECLCLLGKN